MRLYQLASFATTVFILLCSPINNPSPPVRVAEVLFFIQTLFPLLKSVFNENRGVNAKLLQPEGIEPPLFKLLFNMIITTLKALTLRCAKK